MAASKEESTILFMGPYHVSQDPPLYLSAFSKDDLEELVRFANLNDSIYRGTLTFEYPFKLEHGEARLRRAEEDRRNTGRNHHWAMRTSPMGPIIGLVGLHDTPACKSNDGRKNPKTGQPLRSVELGYCMSPEHAGKGYAWRAAQFLFKQIAVQELNVDVVRGYSHVWNKASCRILEKIGLSYQEEQQVFMAKWGEERTVASYAWFAEGTEPFTLSNSS